jgi:hypothetical protein
VLDKVLDVVALVDLAVLAWLMPIIGLLNASVLVLHKLLNGSSAADVASVVHSLLALVIVSVQPVVFVLPPDYSVVVLR